ncbi:hypothetical protein SPRG_20103 [Saprolegnia parasitica CBS 223.65]|uniref:Uncharacterized protein n=1 Tax=Saprolegnia parasitica (strain CBS 223.65) TaxID=695850 RepID=A0A067CER2_SAPPC|nr:hypothetical protein SPRG_20103 [Saprolegnia parasitica CBS 223.65]KDO28998.1 hypothetical protein SPRG_20103 [Saprolegnia parasitica CBS 223.65]|eukprot:XP_012200327.1 hypothetical protein SPRG_20103 [Saprolegnia parasitica CBS 223.65]
MPFGLKLDTVSGWRLMSLADADDLDKAASVASNAIMATPALQFDPCVRILTAKACGDTRYALLVQRIYEDAGATQFYLVEDRGDRPALPKATPVHLHAAA